jgi:uncharacterized membrane protein (GlpM family)
VIYYLIKVVLSAVLIVLISEIAKRSSFIGGLVASLPVVSLLAFVWLYFDTRSIDKVANLSQSIFWLVLPSLALFLALPWLLRKTENFALSLCLATAVMLAAYGLTVLALRHLDIEL